MPRLCTPLYKKNISSEERRNRIIKKKQSNMKNKKLLAVFVTLMCIWIAFCTKWGIDMCDENKRQLIEDPGESHDMRYIKDSTVVFDSLGIKIVGYNIE